MRPVSTLVLIVALALSAAVSVAQEPLKILRIRPFGGDGLASGEAAALQNLVTSYVVELRMFRVIDAEGQELALKEAETAVQLGTPKDIAPLAADFILSATAVKAGGLIIFTMDITRVSSGEKKSVADTVATVNELILASRRLTRNLFDRSPETASTQPLTGGTAGDAPANASNRSLGNSGVPEAQPKGSTFQASPMLAQLAGTWKGDKGLDRISMMPDGRGVAVLSTGPSMKVRATVSGQSIMVVQDQPSIPEFYRSPGLDLKTARVVAAQARLWKWIFSLSSDGNNLVGVKESIFVKVESNGTVAVDNNYVREASWIRLYR
jgi:hypothetical protein